MPGKNVRFSRESRGAQIGRNAGVELNGSAPAHVWLEFGEGICPSPGVEDGLLFAILHRLKEEGEPVRVEGLISAHAVRGVQDLQEVWHNLLPRQYRPIPIEYSNIRLGVGDVSLFLLRKSPRNQSVACQ